VSAPRLRDATFVLATFTVSRIWIALWAYAGHRMHPFRAPVIGGYSGVSMWWLNVWTTYDSVYFLEIAQHGYRPLTSAFFPLYPLLLRPFGPGENALALAGIAISNLAFLIALWLLLQLNRTEFGQVTARRSVLVLAFFPTAVFTMAVYTDALFLALAIGSLYAARLTHWKTAGVIGVLAALTRNAGVVLTAALCAEWYMQRRRATTPLDRHNIIFLCLPALAFFGMQAYFGARFGRLTLLEAQSFFGRAPSLPFSPIVHDLQTLAHHVTRFDDNVSVVQFIIVSLNVAASCGVFAFAWRFRKRLPLADSVLMCGVMIMQLCYARTFGTRTVSSARYVLSTSGVSTALTLELERRSSPAIRYCFVVLALLLCGFMSLLFGMKDFIS
jgi:hypothetical protein